MEKIGWIVVWVWGFSSHASAGQSWLCEEDAYKQICESAEYKEKTQKSKEFRAQFVENLGIVQFPPLFAFSTFNSKLKQFDAPIDRETMVGELEKMTHSKMSDWVGVFESVKTDIAYEISRHFSQGFLSLAVAAHLKKTLDGTKFVLADAKLFKLEEVPIPLMFVGMKRFYLSCGSAGSGLNGYYTGSGIVICPGFILDAYSRARDESEFFESLRWLFAHELGHSIGSQKFPFYESFGKCLKSRFGIPESKLTESSADQWATLALARYFERHYRSLDQMEGILKAGNAWFCGSEGGSSHPSSKERVNILITKNKKFRESVGCPVSVEEKQQGCDIRAF